MRIPRRPDPTPWEPFSFIVPAFVVPCCFNERVPCSRPGMARSTRRSKPDQRGAETLGGLPAQLHAIRKVGFDQLVRENACKDTRCGGPACSPWRDWKTLYFELPRDSKDRRPIVSVAPSLLLLLAHGTWLAVRWSWTVVTVKPLPLHQTAVPCVLPGHQR